MTAERGSTERLCVHVCWCACVHLKTDKLKSLLQMLSIPSIHDSVSFHPVQDGGEMNIDGRCGNREIYVCTPTLLPPTLLSCFCSSWSQKKKILLFLPLCFFFFLLYTTCFVCVCVCSCVWVVISHVCVWLHFWGVFVKLEVLLMLNFCSWWAEEEGKSCWNCIYD